MLADSELAEPELPEAGSTARLELADSSSGPTQVPVLVPDDVVALEPGQVAVCEVKHMLVLVSQQKLLPPGGVPHWFTQSASMLQAPWQPEPLVVLPPPAPVVVVVVVGLVVPPPPEVVAVPVVAPPPLAVLALPPFPAPVVVAGDDPVPPTTFASLEPAQATNSAALRKVTATKLTVACFTVLWRPYASASRCTTVSLR